MYQPPYDLNAENAVLGSIMIDLGGNTLSIAKRIINPGMFYDDANKAIFHAMTKITGNCVDLVTVSDRLKQDGDMERVGGGEKIMECMKAVGHCRHIEHYCKIVARTFYERKIGDKCIQWKSDPSSQGLDEIRKLVLRREELNRPILQEIKETLHTAAELINKNSDLDRFTVGLPTVDTIINGIHGQEINTWAASTNRGKSVFLANLALHSAQMYKTIYFGTEMSAVETVNRMIPMSGGPAAWQIRKGLSSEQIDKYMNTADKLSGYHLSIIDNPEPSLEDIERAIEASDAKIVILDYLERFSMPKAECLRLKIAEFMRRLKTLARKYNVAIHMAAQLNRFSYGKDEGEQAPSLNMLSESSAVEKESDRVFLLWAPNQLQKEDANGMFLELIIAKNRHGRKGSKFNLYMDYQSLKITEAP